jgi:hypothetical protein
LPTRAIYESHPWNGIDDELVGLGDNLKFEAFEVSNKTINLVKFNILLVNNEEDVKATL